MTSNSQLAFWRGTFGDAYTDRNQGDAAARLARWSKMLARADRIGSAFEVGTNTGNNLDALRLLLPAADLAGVEINAKAQAIAAGKGFDIALGAAQDVEPGRMFDLAFTAGVLIHINPPDLPMVYAKLVAMSRRYVLVAEYYNPTPVSVVYRGNSDVLFKRDFAGEIMDAHGLRLVDYGFVYHRDPKWPADDYNWFLMEKR